MGKEVNITRIYPFPIEQVWDAIASSEALAEWLMPNDFRLEAGHEFTFRTKPQPGFDGLVKCKVINFEVPKRLEYSWQGGPLRKPTLVSFELQTVPDGTRLTFRHSGFEGFINQYIVRFILGKGWKDLLNNKIVKFLER